MTTKSAFADTANSVPVTMPTSTMAAPPGMQLIDPFIRSASEGAEAFFDGDYVKIDQERGWIRGQKKEAIGATDAFVANLQEARHGHIKFAKGDGEGVERHTMLIMDCPELPPCPACGSLVDEHDDKRCDWRPIVYLPLRSVTDPDDVVCFTGTGKGARRAVAQLCRVYAREGVERQGKSPAIMLKTWSFDNKAGGRTTWPDFKIVGWDFFTPGVAMPEPKRSRSRSRPRPRRVWTSWQHRGASASAAATSTTRFHSEVLMRRT